MVKLEHITKSYSRNYVLNDISLNIPKAKITGIIGPNGAGKSTLLKIITGFLLPDKGELFINDKRVLQFDSFKSIISYMPEKMQLYPNYFVGEFLKYFHKMQKYKDINLLNHLQLEEVLNKKIKTLSKGWHQRLKLYLALCSKKPFIVLDEPFEGFDPMQMNKIAEIIKEFKVTGKTFVLSIHQLTFAEKICDNIVILSEGKVVINGDIKALYERYKTNSLEKIFITALEE